MTVSKYDFFVCLFFGAPSNCFLYRINDLFCPVGGVRSFVWFGLFGGWLLSFPCVYRRISVAENKFFRIDYWLLFKGLHEWYFIKSLLYFSYILWVSPLPFTCATLLFVLTSRWLCDSWFYCIYVLIIYLIFIVRSSLFRFQSLVRFPFCEQISTIYVCYFNLRFVYLQFSYPYFLFTDKLFLLTTKISCFRFSILIFCSDTDFSVYYSYRFVVRPFRPSGVVRIRRLGTVVASVRSLRKGLKNIFLWVPEQFGVSRLRRQWTEERGC